MFGILETLKRHEQETDRSSPGPVDVLTRLWQSEQSARADRIAEMRAQMQVMASDPPLVMNSVGSGMSNALGNYSAGMDMAVGTNSVFGPPSGLYFFDPSMYRLTRGSAEMVEEPSREMLQRAPVDVQDLDLTDPRKRLATEAEALLGYTPLREELRTPGTLKRALAGLEMEILDWESVTAYKKQMAAHYETSGKMQMPTWRLTKLKDYKAPVPEYVLQKAVEIKKILPEAEFYVEQLAVDPFLIVTLKPLNDFMSPEMTLNRELDPEMAAYVEVWSEPKFETTM
jgi:hypothetical protein